MRPSDSPLRDAAPLAEHDRAEAAHSALENLFDLSPDAIFVTDVQGVIRGANPRAAELFGHSQVELFGMAVENLMPQRFRQPHTHYRENFTASPRTRQMGIAMNTLGLRKDGSEFPVDVMLRPLETTSGPVVLTFLRDMSEQRTALDNLRQSDIELRSILEVIQDYAIFLLDPDGCVATWSPGAERIEGYPADEILGLNYARFFIQEDIDRGRPAELLQLASAQGRVEEEGWRVRKDGSRFWANTVLSAIRNDTGAITGYAKVARDFSDRMHASEAVMQQLTSAVMANLDVRKLLSAISASVADLIPHECATLGLFDPASNGLMFQFLGGNQGGMRRGDRRLPLEGSPDGEAFSKRMPVLLERLEGAGNGGPRFAPENVHHLIALGMQSGCWVPLVYSGNAIGTLAVASRREAAFSRRDQEMLTQVARPVAMAVNNANVFRQMCELRDRLREERQYLEEEINIANHFDEIVGESTGLRLVLSEIETVAPTDATVLIQGETGTGKELLARAIHRLSPRNDRTFIKLNCAAIPAGLLESELFGHEKGAFTGAIARKLGRLELAHEGTLFLDEVGEMPLDLQPKLLRALQEREVERVGGNRPIPVNIRLIAATNRDLAKMVAEKTFRDDLFYRLKVFPIFAPPLRERTEDIPALVRHFVSAHSRRMGKVIETIREETMEALMHWPWPGNIRELENFLERAVILTRGPVLYVPLAELQTEAEHVSAELEDPTLHTAEREHILRVLREAGGQIGGPDGAATRLGLKRTTLNSKLKKLGIERSDYMQS